MVTTLSLPDSIHLSTVESKSSTLFSSSASFFSSSVISGAGSAGASLTASATFFSGTSGAGLSLATLGCAALGFLLTLTTGGCSGVLPDPESFSKTVGSLGGKATNTPIIAATTMATVPMAILDFVVICAPNHNTFNSSRRRNRSCRQAPSSGCRTRPIP